MKVCLFSLLLWVGVTAFAADPTSPGVLYHWAKLTSLSRVAKMNRGTEGFPLDTIMAKHYLAVGYPELADKSGTYAWSHPVTGLAAAATEIYGGEVLVKIKLKDTVRIKEVLTYGDTPRPDKIDASGKLPQLLFHRHFEKGGGKLLYSEYVILDPSCVETFSTSPEASKTELVRELAHLKDPNYVYAKKDLHYSGFENNDLSQSVFNQKKFKKMFASYVSDFLALKKSRIPPRFRHVYGEPIEPCKTAFTEVGEGE